MILKSATVTRDRAQNPPKPNPTEHPSTLIGADKSGISTGMSLARSNYLRITQTSACRETSSCEGASTVLTAAHWPHTGNTDPVPINLLTAHCGLCGQCAAPVTSGHKESSGIFCVELTPVPSMLRKTNAFQAVRITLEVAASFPMLSWQHRITALQRWTGS